jgi:hypothetical protein
MLKSYVLEENLLDVTERILGNTHIMLYMYTTFLDALHVCATVLVSHAPVCSTLFTARELHNTLALMLKCELHYVD